MNKTAIFVEGQTELIVVREYLLKFFEWANIDLVCRSILGNRFIPAQYDYPNPIATNHFQLINVGNDARVLSIILKREEFLLNAGYEKIIGLRDMYSSSYKEEVTTRSIDEDINQRFINGTDQIIQAQAREPNNIKMQFAIMETEAWFLGLYEIFERLDARLTTDFINQELGINLVTIDPEITIFHPANIVEAIYKLVGKSYDKKRGDIEAIANLLTKEDYESLLVRDKCNSFNIFHETIFPQV